MAEFSTDELGKLAEAMAKAVEGKTTREEKRAAIEKLAQTKEGNKLHRLSNKEQQTLLKQLKELKKTYPELAKDTKAISERFSDLEDNLRAVRSSLRGFGSAAYAGTGSISEFTENLRGSSEVLNFVADLGKTFDINAETFRGLAEVGGNFNQSIVEMRRAAASAALPLDDFAALVRDNATTLAALYGSTTRGAMGIAGLSEALRTEATPELASLGFTVDEINETLLANLDRQRRTGIFDRLTDKQRIESAGQFAKELDRLAKLTGQQRAELRAQLDQQAANARFAAFIRTQDDDTQRRLSGFAATIGAVSPMLSEGMQDIIANAGVPVTEAGMQLVQNFPEMQSVVRSLIAGTINSEQALMQMRDLSVKSLDRFSAAAATGQVEFLNLTPGIVNLAGLTLEYGKVLDEQGNVVAGGTSALMQFQENAKRLSAATQSLETGFYSMLGSLGGEGTTSVVGAIGKMSDNFVKGTSDFTKALLYGTKTLTGMGLNLLKNTLPTYMAVYKGTRDANLVSGGGGGGMFGGVGKKAGGFAKGVGRRLPMLGAIGTAGMSIHGLADDDPTNDKSSWAGIAGSVLGGIAGAMLGGPMGAMVGATLGNMAGSAVGGMFSGDGRAVGTMGATGQRFEPETKLLQIDKGETVLNQKEAKTFANLNFEPLENKMTSMVTELNATNKKLTNMVDGVNMLVGVNSKILRSTEGSLRVQRNVTGNVLSA